MAFHFELRWSHQTKRIFIGINVLGIIASVTGFIIGLIKFQNKEFNSWNTASFIGGSVPSVTMFYAIYFTTSLVAIRWHSVPIITIYMIFTYSSILIRAFTLILFWLYGVEIQFVWVAYLFLVIELILSTLAHTIRRVMIEESPLTASTLSSDSSSINVTVERRNSLEEREKRYMKN